MFCDQPTGQLGCRADRSQPMAEITVVGLRVGGQLLGCPAVCAGVMRRGRKIAQIGCASMEQTRRATEERDQKRECGESAHHPYGSGPLQPRQAGQLLSRDYGTRITADLRGWRPAAGRSPARGRVSDRGEEHPPNQSGVLHLDRSPFRARLRAAGRSSVGKGRVLGHAHPIAKIRVDPRRSASRDDKLGHQDEHPENPLIQ